MKMRRFLLGILVSILLSVPVFAGPELAHDTGPQWPNTFDTGRLYHAVRFDAADFDLTYPIVLRDIKVFLPPGYFGEFFIAYEDTAGFPMLPVSLPYRGYISNPDSTWQWVNSLEEIGVEVTQPFFIVLKGYLGMSIGGDLGSLEGGTYTGNSYMYKYSSALHRWDWHTEVGYGIVDLYGDIIWIGFLDYCVRVLVQ